MLSKRIAVYIPSTENVDQPLDPEKRIKIVSATMQIFARQFGGATASDVTGGYVANDGHLVTEKITIVYSFTDDAGFISGLPVAKQVAGLLARGIGQESVLIESSLGVEFVS